MLMVKKEEDDESVLGYKVRSLESEMAEVALKFKQLEAMMGNVQENGLAHLTTNTIGGVIGTTITTTTTIESTRPVILVNAQDNDVRLFHTLTACAEAVKNINLTIAEALVKQIGCLAVS
ncbi:hypothetical protein YC2023_024416 [Brassica napus]